MGTKQIVFSEKNGYSPQNSNYGRQKEHIPEEKTQELIENAYQAGVKDTIKQQKKRAQIEKEGHEEGIKEQAKEEAKKQKNVEDKLAHLSSREEISLLDISTFFPFDLFPDTLHIDTTKVTIINREFFSTERVLIISFKDILDVIFEKSWFLGNLIITYLPKSENMGMLEPKTYKIQLLKCEEARKAKNILKGMLLARREGVDVSQIEPHELKTMIERFGKSDAEE